MYSITKHRTQLVLIVILFTAFVQNSDAVNDSTFVHNVFRRILAVTAQPEKFSWPPNLVLDKSAEIDAHAQAVRQDDSELLAPSVSVSEGLLSKIIENDPDRLAFVLGHEIAHIIHGDVKGIKGKTDFLQTIFSREQEIAADQKGMELLLAAGYSYQKALKCIKRFIELGIEYSSFEGLSADHPSWKERIALLDKEQAKLWMSMSAFENGTVFLLVEQYAAAERCFRNVVQDFPGCYEAWANLGYTLLMQYCDALDADDIKHFDIGHLMVGGFYRRPESLEQQVRGVDEELWWDAVGALREALRLKPDLILAKANLGVAYLVRPLGKDAGQAAKYLTEAVAEAEKDTSLDMYSKLTVYVNGGVAELADGSIERSVKSFDKAEIAGRNFSGKRPAIPIPQRINALLYNRAFIYSQSKTKDDRIKAARMFEDYLKHSSQSSLWWIRAYEQYAQLCKENNIDPILIEKIHTEKNSNFRYVTTVKLGKKEQVSLAEPVSEIKKRLGEAQIIPVAGRTNLVLLKYSSHGIEILASDKVLAIFLKGTNASPLFLQSAGIGARITELKVGITKEELETLLKDESYEFKQLINPDINYRFYSNLGLAVRVRKGIVEELVIAQIPFRDSSTRW